MQMLRIAEQSEPTLVELAQTLMREYAALPHTLGRWPTATAEIAALPTPYVSPRGAFFIATDGDDALGCGALLALDAPGYAEFKRVYVRPGARGRGVGEAITRALFAEAATLGFTTIRLDTVAELAAAQALYRRLGFHVIPHYKDGLLPDALCFERAVML